VSTCYAVALLAAQSDRDPKDAQVWDLQGLRAGYCVRFLLDPRKAPRTPKNEFVLLRADQDPHLNSALRLVIATQPEFASWAPSRVCFYYLEAVQVGNHRVADKDRRKSQMIAAWSLSTAARQTGAQRDFVVELYGGRGALSRAAEGSGVPVEEVRTAVSEAADTLPDTYTVEVGKTLLVWNGRPAGDSTRVTQPILESWALVGLRGLGIWQAELELVPQWSQPLVGSFRVEGKGDLAQALKSSPIRFVGPLYRGGGGKLRFRR
jgi:hypothetical protein